MCRFVPVATPRTGVTKLGLVCMAKMLPVPVWAVTVAVAVTLPLPSNDGVVHVIGPVMPIVRPVVNLAALPVVFWFNVGNVQFVNVPLDGVPRTPPATRLPLAVPVKAPVNVVAFTVLVNVALWS